MNKYLKQYKWANIKAMRRNNRTPPKECNEDFNGKLVIITGATSGIGYSTALEYAKHGANLLLINRNLEKTLSLCNEITEKFEVKCDYKIADFSSIKEVHDVANEILNSDIKIDVLIHNAGVYNTKRILTRDGLEQVFQVDYLSSFIINFKLMEKLKSQGKCRIILVNSEGHRFAISGLKLNDLNWNKRRYSGLKGYGSAKTAQLLTMLIFNDNFQNSDVTINAMHPGNVKTNMGANNGKFYRLFKRIFVDKKSKDPIISAKALYYLGVSPEIENISGKFFNLTTEEEPAPPALDKEVAEELWNISLNLGGLN